MPPIRVFGLISMIDAGVQDTQQRVHRCRKLRLPEKCAALRPVGFCKRQHPVKIGIHFFDGFTGRAIRCEPFVSAECFECFLRLRILLCCKTADSICIGKTGIRRIYAS